MEKRGLEIIYSIILLFSISFPKMPYFGTRTLFGIACSLCQNKFTPFAAYGCSWLQVKILFYWARAYSHEVATGIIPVTANTGNPVFFKLETIVQLSNASCKLSKTGFSPCLMPVPALSREPL